MVDLDRSEDSCLFCGKDARKKEEIMVEPEVIKEAEVAEVPPKPKNRKKVLPYYEQNKEAMVADYNSMSVSSFLLKWGISTATWQKLKKLWGVPKKSKGIRTEKAAPAAEPEKKPLEPEETAPLTEHERYLILLGYQQATREFLKYLK